MHYNARWYDPSLGRFAQADIIVPPGVHPHFMGAGGLDRYAYVNNSPMNYVDPSGHFTCSNDKNSDDYCPNHSPSGGGSDDEDDGMPECPYHHCQVDTNLYSMGWDSFGQAWDIWTNPSSSYGQQWLAGSYMSYWGGAHLIGAAGIYLLATQYIIAATLLNIGVNVGIDAMIVTSGGNKYTHEQAFATAAFSVIMGATSGAITKSIGFNTSRQFLKNLGWQATLQFGGNSAYRAINGQPTTVSDFVTDVSAGVPSTIFQMPHMQIGNPNSSSQIGEAFSAILSGLGGYPDNNPVLIPAP